MPREMSLAVKDFPPELLLHCGVVSFVMHLFTLRDQEETSKLCCTERGRKLVSNKMMHCQFTQYLIVHYLSKLRKFLDALLILIQ